MRWAARCFFFGEGGRGCVFGAVVDIGFGACEVDENDDDDNGEGSTLFDKVFYHDSGRFLAKPETRSELHHHNGPATAELMSLPPLRAQAYKHIYTHTRAYTGYHMA